MSHFDLTDKRGNCYRLSLGSRIPVSDSLATHYARADALLYQVDTGQLLQARDHFYGVGRFPLLSYWQQQRRGNNETPLCPLETLADALSHHELTIISVTSDQVNSEDKRGILRVKIRQALAAIIAQERTEAAGHARRLANESAASRTLIYTGAFFNGLWNAGTDLAKWLKEVNDLVSPSQRILRAMHSAHRAAARTTGDLDGFLETYAEEHLKGEKRELVEALGFDPSAISSEQLDQAMAVADLIWDDPALRSDITRFAGDYVTAQHAVELTNLSGSAAFEVLFTIILAAATAGIGLAVSASSQARHLAKFRKVGDLLMEFAEQARKIRQMSKPGTAKGDSGLNRSLDQLPTDEITINNNVEPTAKGVSKGKVHPQREPSQYVAKVSPEEVNWSKSGPNGLDVHDPREFAAGREIFDTLVDNGLEPDLAFRISRELLESGVAEPERLNLMKGEKLYKVMPKGGNPPGDTSPYFMSKEMLDGLPEDASKAGDLLGLPQVADSFDIYEITATKNVTVYQSKIAEFSVNGGQHLRSGGGTQTLVIKRDCFTTPKKL